MDTYEYEEQALATMKKFENPVEEVSCWTICMAGEVGEVCDQVKKEIWHGHPRNVVKMKDELGDVLWYLTAVARQYGLTLDEIMAFNLYKLHQRYPNGFSETDSINRKA